MSNPVQPVPVDNNSNTTVNHKRTVPQADIDMGTVLTSVSAQYAACGIVLPWISGAQAIQLATDYNNDLRVRNTEGGKRPSLTQQLKDSDKEQDSNLAYAKGYFIEKYDKDHAAGYYAQMGLSKIGDSYRFPYDRDGRLEALRMIVDALTTHGFVTNTYGANYWQTIYNDYDILLSKARNSDSLVTSKVSSKNNYKAEGKAFLKAAVHLVQAMYRNDAKAKLREWGFQKEKY